MSVIVSTCYRGKSHYCMFVYDGNIPREELIPFYRHCSQMVMRMVTTDYGLIQLKLPPTHKPDGIPKLRSVVFKDGTQYQSIIKIISEEWIRVLLEMIIDELSRNVKLLSVPNDLYEHVNNLSHSMKRDICIKADMRQSDTSKTEYEKKRKIIEDVLRIEKMVKEAKIKRMKDENDHYIRVYKYVPGQIYRNHIIGLYNCHKKMIDVKLNHIDVVEKGRIYHDPEKNFNLFYYISKFMYLNVKSLLEHRKRNVIVVRRWKRLLCGVNWRGLGLKKIFKIFILRLMIRRRGIMRKWFNIIDSFYSFVIAGDEKIQSEIVRKRLEKAIKNEEIKKGDRIMIKKRKYDIHYYKGGKRLTFTKRQNYKSPRQILHTSNGSIQSVYDIDIEALRYCAIKTSHLVKAPRPINLNHRSPFLKRIITNCKYLYESYAPVSDILSLMDITWVHYDVITMIRDVLYVFR